MEKNLEIRQVRTAVIGFSKAIIQLITQFFFKEKNYVMIFFFKYSNT